MSHAVSDPLPPPLRSEQDLTTRGAVLSPFMCKSRSGSMQPRSLCCSGPGGTARLSSVQDACTRGGGKSIAAVIRCQHTLSTSALEMVSPKPPWEVLLQQLALLAPFLPSQMACPALLLKKPFHLTLLSRLCCKAESS